jgi:voltage-gated potassium channel
MGARFTMNEPHQHGTDLLRMHMSQFWSGDLGLTLVTISVAILIFVITPLGKAGLYGRVFFDLIVVTLMISGAILTGTRHLTRAFMIGFVAANAVILVAGRMHPTPFLHQLGSLISTATLLLYVRIVLLLMFRQGPITWSRIQGGICAYLLLGMAWASAYSLAQDINAGSFQFVTPPVDIDQLTAKLTYYSFSTLTTVGGEVIPLTAFTRSLSTAEAVVGQLYPAVLMGALVAMALQTRSKS